MNIYAGVKKETADNILINGSLYASAKEWTINSANTLTQNDGYVSIKCTSTGTGTYPNYQAFSIVSGDTSDTVQILYAYAKVRGKTTNVSYPRVYLSSYKNGVAEVVYSNLMSIDGKIGTELNDGEWHTVSYRAVTYNIDTQNYWDYFRIAFGISASTINDEMDIKEVFLVNLTETFGRGNEPSKEWCDENLTNYADKIAITTCKGVAKKIKRAYGGVKKETADNILTNGSLYASAKEWTINSANTLTQNDGYVSIKCTSTGTGTYPNYQAFSIVSGDTSDTVQILYAYAKVRGKTTNVSYPRVYLSSYKNGVAEVVYSNLMSIDGKIGTELNDGEWHTVSYRAVTYNIDTQNYWDYFRIAFGISASTINDEMDIKEVFLVNLTETFGRGNEPSKAWCDENLTNYLDEIPITNCKGIAKKLIKGYIGVGGVARPFFSDEKKLFYYGNANDLSVARTRLRAASVSNYALFAGGLHGTVYEDVVDTYSSNLVKGTAANLPQYAMEMCAGSVGDHAVFAGGQMGTSSYYNGVVAYDLNLTKNTSISNMSNRRNRGATGNVEDYILFAGGSTTRTVDAYSSKLVKQSLSDLSGSRNDFLGLKIGEHCIFPGGASGVTPYATVDIYDKNLVKSTATALSTARRHFMGAVTGEHALIAGGVINSDGDTTSTVETYDSSLVKGTVANLTANSAWNFATSLKGFAIFPYVSDGVTDVYSENLVKQSLEYYGKVRHNAPGTSVGDYAIFAGGGENDTCVATTDVYQIIE